MHGHRLRLEAERKRVHLLDRGISVGAVYGAMKRLASEGLLGKRREPRRAAYPHSFRRTPHLVALRRDVLNGVWFKYDPSIWG